MPAENQDLERLIAAAGASAHPQEQDEHVLEVVLAAFNAAGAVGAQSAAGPSERSTRTARQWAATAARCAAALCVVTAGSVAVASAGILPPPVQTFAHDIFGGIGVPAPTAGGAAGGITASASPVTSATASATATIGRPTPTSTATASANPGTSTQATSAVVSLCDQVVGNGDEWRTTMSQPDLALLTATAGGDTKIGPYCAQLLQAPQQGDTTEPPENGTAATPSHDNGNGGGSGNGNGTGGGNGNTKGTGNGTGGGNDDAGNSSGNSSGNNSGGGNGDGNGSNANPRSSS